MTDWFWRNRIRRFGKWPSWHIRNFYFASVTSVLFAMYLVGYGAAAFGVGPLQTQGISLPTLDAAAVGRACIVAALAFAIVRIVGEQA